MLRAVRILILGFVLGAGAAFLVSLLRRQRLSAMTGYVPPTAADGPDAMPGAGPNLREALTRVDR